jgi:hypothetical protein
LRSGSPLEVSGDWNNYATINGQTVSPQVEVKAGRINHLRIGVLPVATQTINPANADARIQSQYGPVRDDIVTDTHVTETWTATTADIYGALVNLIEDVIGDVGIRDAHPAIDDDRPQFARVLIGESERVIKNIHPRAGSRVHLNRPPLLDIVDDIVTDRNIVTPAVVDAVIVVLIETIGTAPVLSGRETSDVVDDIAIQQNVTLVDINANLPIAGIGADATDLVDTVADDFRESAAVEHLNATRAATGVGHTNDLEALDANVVGAREVEPGFRVVLSVDLGSPLVARSEGHQFAGHSAAGDADNRSAALVGTASSIVAILDNYGVPRVDDVRRLLDGAEGTILCTRVGV